MWCFARFGPIQFVIFKPLSYCFEETIGFDVMASFARPPVSRLIKPGNITENNNNFPRKRKYLNERDTYKLV